MNVNISSNDSLICVQGADAKKFLQGQLTCDLELVTDNNASLGAHCNPKGRVISLFRLFYINSAYYLILPRGMVNIAMQALKKYAVFFKVTIQECHDPATIHATVIPEPEYRLEQIKLGIPGIYPETSEKYLPHELNLPALGGVSFTKGCYTGQEIISRMQHLGKLKKHLYRTTLNKTGLTPGDDLYSGDTVIGSIVDCCESGYNESVALVLAESTLQRDQT